MRCYKKGMGMNKKGKGEVLKRLAGYIWDCRLEAGQALVLAAAANILSLAGPLFMGRAVDAMSGPGAVDFREVFRCCGWMAVFYLASGCFSCLLSAVMIRLSKKITCCMRSEAFDRLLRVPAGYCDARETGDILSCLSYDINIIHDTLSTDLMAIITSFFTVVISLYMMLSISVEMMLVFAVAVPVSIAAARWITLRSRQAYREKSEELGRLNGFAEERIGGRRTIQAYGQQANVCREFAQRNREVSRACYRAQCYSSLSGPAINFINNSSLAAISVLGALFYLSGRMSLGTISAFVLYSRKCSGPVSEIASNVSDLQASLAAAKRVFELLDEKTEQELWEGRIRLQSRNLQEDQKAQENREGQEICSAERNQGVGECQECRNTKVCSGKGIVFSHVTFGYDMKMPVLCDISFQVPEGTTTAVVGPTGSGKTTLINLLMGFYPCGQGSISMDGREIGALSLEMLRKTCAVILQESWIFSGTVYENIAYGSSGASREAVKEAARKAQLHGYISRLPDGYDTRLGEGGLKLSKGQRQMVAIARAMLPRAPVLIFDEATSDVDIRTEKQLQAAMAHLAKGKTCILIAHRLSTIKHADQIIVLQKGRIAQKGNHWQLLKQEGPYREMYGAYGDGI